MRQTSKSITDGTGFVERRLIDAPGAHVMTAGLADQVAFMDNRREISFFTSALASGLTGGADYIPDGIITLRELELFVRHRVALEQQIRIPYKYLILKQGHLSLMKFQRASLFYRINPLS